jgi:putative PIN family toxin of toxin-antitoxin system
MSNELRTVFDTNAIVSALLFEQSVPAKAFLFALGQGKILVSPVTLGELKTVLDKPEFDRYLTREERDQFLEKFLEEATMIEIGESIRACRDPKDDIFLELAISGSASCIVTGDRDLLLLNPFREIPITTPAQFLATFLGLSEDRGDGQPN